MIEHTIVEGRPATVAYITSDFEPCPPIEADLIKVMFDDGRVVFAVPKAAAVEKWDESKHPRGKTTARSTEGSFKPTGDVGAAEEAGEPEPGKEAKPGAKKPAGEEAEAAEAKTVKPEEIEQHLQDPKAIYDDMSMDKGDAGTRQPTSDLDELYKLAKPEEAEFQAELDNIAKMTGGKMKYQTHKEGSAGDLDPRTKGTNLKGHERAFQKTEADYGGDASKLRDIVRGTMEHPTVHQSRMAAALYAQTLGDRLLRVKDRFASPAPGGYRDMMLNVRTKGGVVGEVQFVSKNIAEFKSGRGHDMFKDSRTLPKSSRERARLEAAQEQLYNKMYQLDGNGDWGKAVRT